MASCMGWGLGIMKKCTALSLAVNYESNEYLYLHNIRVAALLPFSATQIIQTVKPICLGDHVINYTNNEDMQYEASCLVIPPS